MATTLNTTVGSKSANSWITATDADNRLTAVGIYNLTAWTALAAAAKEFRLVLAAKLMKSQFRWRGWPVYKNQALPFPRRLPDDDTGLLLRDRLAWDPYYGYGSSGLFTPRETTFYPVSWEWPDDDPIVVPEDIKTVQAMIAYSIIHKRLVSQSNPADGPDDGVEIQSMKLFGLSMTASDNPVARLDNTVLESVIKSEHAPIYMLLEDYVTSIVVIPGIPGPVLLDEVA